MSASVAPLPLALAEDGSIPTSCFNAECEHQPASSLTAHSSSLQTNLKPNKLFSGLARRTLGITLLLITVSLWTTSNFLASTIFADDSFSKPYFVTYINTSFFSVFLPVIYLRRVWVLKGSLWHPLQRKDYHGSYAPVIEDDNEASFKPSYHDQAQSKLSPSNRLNVRETAKLSLEFSVLWFAANYFVAACLEYTTVASSTILTSTSSIWTLIFGALIGVEGFTTRKLVGVIASLAGIILISRVDLSGENDQNRGTFPHKSRKQIAIGDTLALASALLYGLYTILMKKRIEDEGRVNMLLFFGFVGAFNLVFLWPGFFLLHFTGVEVFEFPPTKRIWTIILVNSATSLVSDVTWAYAMLLTSPLVVTVGLSLSIPLSLVGQMIINSQNSATTYWVGAGIVFLSFIFINYETREEASQVKVENANAQQEASPF